LILEEQDGMDGVQRDPKWGTLNREYKYEMKRTISAVIT
jgi:hypothetical protein